MKVSYQDYLDAQREAAFSGKPTYSYSEYSAMVTFQNKLKKSFKKSVDKRFINKYNVVIELRENKL